MYEEYKNHCIGAYAAYIKDDKELLSCTSGGVATALSKKIINDGGYVAGVRYSDDFHSIQYDITNTIEGLEKFKGSKYAEVEKGTIYKDVKSLLEDNKTVLFFGLPCVVMALNRFLKKDYPNLYTVELICHGPTDIEVHRQYIDYLEKKYKSSICDFNVRKKEGKWLPPYLYAKFKNRKVFQKPFYDTEYGFAFNTMAKPGCYQCRVKGNYREGDIMLGDYWGVTPNKPFWNNKGVSAIIIHSKKGLELFLSVDNINIFATSFEDIVKNNLNVITPRIINKKKDNFIELFKTNSLFKTVIKCMSPKEKMHFLLKKILPNNILLFIKKLTFAHR